MAVFFTFKIHYINICKKLHNAFQVKLQGLRLVHVEYKKLALAKNDQHWRALWRSRKSRQVQYCTVPTGALV